ncbi:hypothetical protein TNCV_1199511 [Trichonephila clavipes]|uniref:Uncharacterized protein n=1 Tax=Trichonephila clavipes TaxID=2585209 RepID=A0A8X6SBV7_TRICX|nr:hypothetical protein TNCV_1199511 [Trichonephila clavipes]
MANLSDQSFTPTNLGRIDEEMIPPGLGVSQWRPSGFGQGHIHFPNTEIEDTTVDEGNQEIDLLETKLNVVAEVSSGNQVESIVEENVCCVCSVNRFSPFVPEAINRGATKGP